ncbi:MAG: hypothetical protein CL844_04975 [Crocinitomicaceae bacterium]|nr:hypothetical protein [Crocinitomicaceae bacterium]|tara:strand:+ start:8778 stop:9263 length:486 start_codon:yes stop_codon:yes gene_type:complete
MTTTIQTVGNLGRNPEIKYFESGSIKCSFTMAAKQKGIKQKDGTWLDPEPFWLAVEVWGKQGENLANKLHKGDTVDVRGELKRETFTRRDGTTGEKLIVVYPSVDVIKSKNQPSQQQQQQPPAAGDTGACPMPNPKPPASSEPPAQWNTAPLVPDSDDIPF